MSMFVVGFLHTSIVCRILGLFFEVVHLRIGDDAGYRNRVSHVLSERSGVAFHIPAAAVIRLEQKLILMRGLLQAPRDRTGVTLAFVIVIGRRPDGHETGKQQTKSQLLHKLFPPGSAFRDFDESWVGQVARMVCPRSAENSAATQAREAGILTNPGPTEG